MLLNAYAFWKMGEIALWGAIASFTGAGILAILGIIHLRRAAPQAEVFAGLTAASRG